MGAAVAAVIIRKEKDLVAHFRTSGALRAESAVPQLGPQSIPCPSTSTLAPSICDRKVTALSVTLRSSASDIT